jgi:hypothetical protein
LLVGKLKVPVGFAGLLIVLYGPTAQGPTVGLATHRGSLGLVIGPCCAFATTVAPVAAAPTTAADNAALVIAPRMPEAFAKVIHHS